MLTLNLAAKLAGCAVLFSSVAAMSIINKKRDGERLRRLRAQIAFVRFVRDRIERFLSPIGDIIKDCDRGLLSDILIGCEGGEFFDTDGLRTMLASGVYYADGGKIFDSFLSTLGSSYREEEVAGCNSCIKDLEALLQKLETDLPKERKSRGVLRFCFAAAIVIILF
ncbi:MAG: hypothetical protein J6S71_00765 [Clostridia bacterium]|nr:hypothetical protein [Clostridia bacterium]